AGLHAEWIDQALAAGKHVLCEKPLTTDLATTAKVVGSAEANGLAVRENIMFPQPARHGRVAELLADGAIGELRMLSSAFTIPARPPEDIRYRPDLGGGSLLDTG